MNFLAPYWLLLSLIPLLLGGVLIRVRRNRQQDVSTFVSSPHLAKRLIKNRSTIPWTISNLLLIASLILLLITLAIPTCGNERVELPTKGRQIYIAMDCSRSMLVKDTAPDRLTRAKTAALEIIEAFPHEQIGLLSFAGNAWLEAPLTTDHTALKDAVLALNENSIPYGGSTSTPLFKLISEKQTSDSLQNALLIILSDGEFHKKPSTDHIRKTVDQGIKIFTLGFGTAKGDLIPNETNYDSVFRDRYGRTVHSTLKEESLKRISLLGNGSYFPGDDYSIIPRLSSELSIMEGQNEEEKSLVIHKHIYLYFIIPAILLLVLSLLTPTLWHLSRTLLPLIITSILLPETHALQPPSKNQLEPSQEAQKITKKIENAKGEQKHRLQFTQGVTAYRTQNFEQSIQSFSDSLLSKDPNLQTESHYNLGNSLYKSGEAYLKMLPQLKKPEAQIKLRQAIIRQWKTALEHYTSGLHLTSQHKNARENYQHVKEKLEELEKKQAEQLKQNQGNEESCPDPQKGEKGEGSSTPQDSEEEGLTWEEIKERVEKEKQGESQAPEGSPKPDETAPEQNAPSEQGDRQEELERRPDESKRDFAERMLREGSDSESGNLRTGRQKFRKPEKDW